MATINLADYKASGLYTIEIDGSTTVSLPSIQGRLLIGSSRKGIMNSVVLIRNTREALSVYGDRDVFLENKGSYFHKTLDVMLKEGPVYALNVLPIDLEDGVDNLDQTGIMTFNTEAASQNELSQTTPVKDLFDRQKFWAASESQLNNTKNSVYTGAQVNKILTVANMSKRNVTVFAFKANVTGYDVTVEEWYSRLGPNVQIPNFLHNDDFIADYFVDLIVVEGDWSDYKRLATDPIYYKYFNVTGLEKDMIDEFLSLKNVNAIARVQGSLIPDFTDAAGNNVSIETVFNNLYPVTEMTCAIDVDALESIELDPDVATPFDDATIGTHRVDIVGHGFEDLAETIDDDTNLLIDTLSYKKPASQLFTYAELNTSTPEDIVIDTVSEPNEFVKAYSGSKLYLAWQLGFLKTGDLMIDGSATPTLPDVYINITQETDGNGNHIAIRATTSPGLGATDVIYHDNAGTNNMVFNNGQDEYMKVVLFSDFDSVSVTNNVITLETTSMSSALLNSYLEFIKPGAYLKANVTDNNRNRMLKILTVAKTVVGGSTYYTVTTMGATYAIDTAANMQLFAYKGYHNYTDELVGTYLAGFKLRPALLPNKTSARQREILDYLFDTNMAAAISEGEGLDIRHIVDSYEGDMASSAKYSLVRLGAIHGRSLVFANDPSMKQFEKSTDPSFKSITTKLVSAEHIAAGGNLSLNPSFKYTFPSDTYNGIPIESFAIFTMPWIMSNDGGKLKAIPPAGYMSNLYLRKIKGGNQFGIAGGKKGIIGESDVAGLEYDLTDSDRAFLEPVGHNLLIRRRGIGTMVFSNNTAYQRLSSALNNAHVRDSLITIENKVDAILFNYLFDFNDEITRIRVRTLVDDYLSTVVSARGISRYDIQIDTTNNTNEVIGANTAIIDIIIDFPRGIHKFINRITIVKVGGELTASSSGFVPS